MRVEIGFKRLEKKSKVVLGLLILLLFMPDLCRQVFRLSSHAACLCSK